MPRVTAIERCASRISIVKWICCIYCWFHNTFSIFWLIDQAYVISVPTSLGSVFIVDGPGADTGSNSFNVSVFLEELPSICRGRGFKRNCAGNGYRAHLIGCHGLHRREKLFGHWIWNWSSRFNFEKLCALIDGHVFWACILVISWCGHRALRESLPRSASISAFVIATLWLASSR